MTFTPQRTDDAAIWTELKCAGPLTIRGLMERKAVAAVRDMHYDHIYDRLSYMERQGAVRRYPSPRPSAARGRWKWEAVEPAPCAEPTPRETDARGVQIVVNVISPGDPALAARVARAVADAINESGDAA